LGKKLKRVPSSVRFRVEFEQKQELCYVKKQLEFGDLVSSSARMFVIYLPSMAKNVFTHKYASDMGLRAEIVWALECGTRNKMPIIPNIQRLGGLPPHTPFQCPTYSAPLAGLMFTFYYAKLKPTVLCDSFYWLNTLHGIMVIQLFYGGPYLYGIAVDFLYRYRYICLSIEIENLIIKIMS